MHSVAALCGQHDQQLCSKPVHLCDTGRQCRCTSSTPQPACWRKHRCAWLAHQGYGQAAQPHKGLLMEVRQVRLGLGSCSTLSGPMSDSQPSAQCTSRRPACDHHQVKLGLGSCVGFHLVGADERLGTVRPVHQQAAAAQRDHFAHHAGGGARKCGRARRLRVPRGRRRRRRAPGGGLPQPRLAAGRRSVRGPDGPQEWLSGHRIRTATSGVSWGGRNQTSCADAA